MKKKMICNKYPTTYIIDYIRIIKIKLVQFSSNFPQYKGLCIIMVTNENKMNKSIMQKLNFNQCECFNFISYRM